MEGYVTSCAPCQARIKHSPEDFKVEELIRIEGMVQEERPDYYPLYRIEKNSIDTFHTAERLSAALNSRVSFGGLKDKKALAIQYATPTSLRSSRPREVVDDKFTAHLVGYVPHTVGRGTVVGNRFEITLRDCCADIEPKIDVVMRAGKAYLLPNFYGLQRFGTGTPGTHMIGRAVVMQNFSEAVWTLLVGADSAHAPEGQLKDTMESQRFEDLERLLPPGKDVEKRVAIELARHPGNWVRAIRAVPLKLRRLYVHAFQSYLFNKSLSAALSSGEDISNYSPGDNWARVSEDGLTTSRVFGVRDVPEAKVVPMMQIAGYAFRDYGSRFDRYVKEAMHAEGINPGHFFVQAMQEVSSEGGFRRPHLALKDVSWRVDGRDARLEFSLAKGQYATALLREIVKTNDPLASGFA